MMENINTVVPGITIVDLDTEILAVTDRIADHTVSGYGLNIQAGKLFNIKFAEFDWFDLSGTDTSDAGKLVRAERKKFTERLKAKGHKNPSTSWLRVREAARLERYPAPAVVSAEQGESGASHNRSPKLRFIEELSALYKFGHRQDDLADDCRKALNKVASALIDLGVDIGMLDAK